jgi:hypothetical protein
VTGKRSDTIPLASLPASEGNQELRICGDQLPRDL